MFEMLPLILNYLSDSMLSSIYTWNFLKGKYRKKITLPAWSAAYFLIQIIIFKILDSTFFVREVAGIISNSCVLLSMQFLFFKKDIQKQFFVALSFVAGKETVKYIASAFCFTLSDSNFPHRFGVLNLEKSIL